VYSISRKKEKKTEHSCMNNVKAIFSLGKKSILIVPNQAAGRPN
jgi:hypothetical protein